MTTDLARWQFATTSIYHFLFIPVTIGLAFLVALLQTTWYRNDNPVYRRLTKFFGTLLLINVAVGVVTGMVQEFEFGMNWSVYSRVVGNVFGGPLAMEGLLAFFLESTFLGLWIFGWDRLPKKVHLACIWLVAGATMLSAAFIMAANSWMQHPVGYVMNAQHQPVLNNIWALFTNPVFLWGYVHVLLASLVTGALVMLAVSAWQIRKQREVEAFRRTAVISMIVLLPAVVLALFVGSELGVIEGTYQPMKIAAAEAQWNTCTSHCSFSVFQIGGGNNDQSPTQIFSIPGPALGAGHQPPERGGKGPQSTPGRGRQEVRTRQLHPQRVHPVLVDAGYGLPGRPGDRLLPVGRLAVAPPPSGAGQVVSPHRPLGGGSSFSHEHRRLDVDRERSPTVDRAGADEDGQGRLAQRHLHRPLDQSGGLRAALRGPGCSRRLPDDPLRKEAPGARSGRG